MYVCTYTYIYIRMCVCIQIRISAIGTFACKRTYATRRAALLSVWQPALHYSGWSNDVCFRAANWTPPICVYTCTRIYSIHIYSKYVCTAYTYIQHTIRMYCIYVIYSIYCVYTYVQHLRAITAGGAKTCASARHVAPLNQPYTRKPRTPRPKTRYPEFDTRNPIPDTRNHWLGIESMGLVN